ncbi:MAG: proton-conducting transporter membrane subunit, partial [Halobacteriaceae archaeon]
MQPAPIAVLGLLFLPFIAASVTPICYRFIGERVAYVAAGVAATCLGIVITLLGNHGTVVVQWVPSYGIAMRLYVDGLALLISTLASGIGVLIFVYSRGYMRGEKMLAKYYATLLAFMGSMLGVALAADLITLFVFWELTSICSFLLIGHYSSERSSLYAARKSMLITVGGGLFMLIGFLMIANVTGTFDMTSFLIGSGPGQAQELLRDAGLFVPTLVLITIGAAAKSAQVPLHLWLPNAMEAPTPVSAFLHSATMVKAGVYLLGRFRPLFVSEEWMLLVATLGLVTMLITAILALIASDIKELLAYSTASHLGLITAGFGFTTAIGAKAGSFHILNHASFKATLFLVAGIVAHETGTRQIDDLSGLRDAMPITAIVATVAALSMAGIPPLNGFYSKEFIFEATYEAATNLGGIAWIYPAIAVIASIFTFLYSLRFVALFYGNRPKSLGHVHRPPVAMLAPAGLLAIAVLFISFLPDLVVPVLIEGALESVAPSAHELHVGLPTHLSPALGMSALTILLGTLAFTRLARIRSLIRDGMWDPITIDWWYDGMIEFLASMGEGIAMNVQTGQLRTYAIWLLTGTFSLTLVSYGVSTPLIEVTLDSVLTTPAILVLLLAVIAGLAIVRAPSHVAGVLTLSILGFMVAIFYILASAPDLALTQIVVETLALLIFLLVLDQLPAYYGEIKRGQALRDGALSLIVGGTVTMTVLFTTSTRPDSKIAEYF